MKTSFHRIYTKDDLELVGLLYEPEEKTNKVLVHVHGMAGNFYENLFIDFLAKTLTGNGVAFFVFNNRGCEYIKDLYKVKGDRRDIVRIGDTFERFEDCVLDIESAINFVENYGFKEVHLSGHSLGSPKIAFYINETKDERIKSLIFLAPADMVDLAKMDVNFLKDLDLANEMIKEGKGNELMPHIVLGEAYLSADTFINLNKEDQKVAIFNFYDLNDPLTILGEISIPAITIMGSKDGALSVPVEKLMERLKKVIVKSPRFETKILGKANHQYDGYQEELANEIRRWLLTF